MKRSTTSGGTRQKSYVTPEMKRTFMRLVSGSYPMAEIADEETRTISMSSPFDRDVVWKLHSIEMRLLAPTCSTQRLTPAAMPDYASHVAAHQRYEIGVSGLRRTSRQHCGFFHVRQHGTSFGRAVRRGETLAGPVARYANPHVLALLDWRRGSEQLKTLLRSLAMTSPSTGASAPAVFHFQSLDVRAFADDAGEPWFCAADVCAVLGYRNPRTSIANHCREKGVLKRDTPTESGAQEMTFINEGNLYRLIVKSRKPEAQAFEQQVMEVILPAIRKTGRYEAAPAAPIGDALKASIAEAVKQALAAQMLPAPAQLPAMKMSIDPRRLIDLMTDLRKIYARLDALGMVASDLPPKWWDQHAVHGIGEPVSRG